MSFGITMTKSNIISHISEVSIPFYDVDSLQIAWHGHYVKYFEIARSELLNKIDYNYYTMAESGYMWPVVDLQIKYIQSAKFGQLIEIHSSIVEYQNRLKISYIIYDKLTQEKLTKGHTTQLAVALDSHELQFISPDVLIHKIENCDHA